jgi:galactokinase
MAVVAYAPGRVNLIGEHTDYNGGLSLPFAIAEGVTVTAAPRGDGEVVARALDLGEEDRFAAEAPPRGVAGWRAFVRGAVAELGDGRAGLELEITGTVPRGAGLASSGALGVALALALAPDGDRLELARACSRVENDWVGARSGLLDQLASLLGEAGHALRIDFSTLETEPVELELGAWRLVTVDSGERRELGASGYNERRRECAAAAMRLGVPSLRNADVRNAAALGEPLARRVRHVLEENARVEQAVAALARGDLPALGGLLDASHASLRDLYDASTPAVERTVGALREAGAAGARMVGGGFGGHVLALLAPDVATPAGALEVAPCAGARVLRR